MHLVAFHAFLSVGEMTSDVTNNDGHCLQYTDVVVDKQGCVIYVQSYIHSATGTITKCVIKRQDGHNCPVYQLESYYRLRGIVMDPVFINIDGSLVGRDQFVRILHKCLSHIGLSGGLIVLELEPVVMLWNKENQKNKLDCWVDGIPMHF